MRMQYKKGCIKFKCTWLSTLVVRRWNENGFTNLTLCRNIKAKTSPTPIRGKCGATVKHKTKIKIKSQNTTNNMSLDTFYTTRTTEKSFSLMTTSRWLFPPMFKPQRQFAPARCSTFILLLRWRCWLVLAGLFLNIYSIFICLYPRATQTTSFMQRAWHILLNSPSNHLIQKSSNTFNAAAAWFCGGTL